MRAMRARVVAATLVATAIGTSAGLVAAATLGTSGGVVDSGTTSVRAGCTGTPNISGAEVSFDEADGYWIDTVGLTSVGGDCRAPSTYTLTVAQSSPGSAPLAGWSGSAPSGNSGDAVAPSITAGAPVDDVSALTGEVRIFYVTETP